MKLALFQIVLLAVLAMVSCQGVHIVDHNPFLDQVINDNPDNFIVDEYFYKAATSAPAEYEEIDIGPALVDDSVQIPPYPYKKYDSPYLRGGK